MCFVADKMLGRLARWLRIMGQDVAYGPELSGAGLLRAARQQGRLILTRDRAVAKRNPPPYLMIRSDHFREQLKQVIEECGLDPIKDAFTRCAECNTVLESVARSGSGREVPPVCLRHPGKVLVLRDLPPHLLAGDAPGADARRATAAQPEIAVFSYGKWHLNRAYANKIDLRPGEFFWDAQAKNRPIILPGSSVGRAGDC